MKTDFLDILRDTLIKNGYRVTNARLETFKLLTSSRPQSMNEIIERSEGKVDRVSIYRNIELFEQLGIINRIHHGWKYKIELSELFLGHHHHLSCLKCSKTFDIEDEQHIDEFIQASSEKLGFTPKRHIFEVEGYCSNCSS